VNLTDTDTSKKIHKPGQVQCLDIDYLLSQILHYSFIGQSSVRDARDDMQMTNHNLHLTILAVQFFNHFRLATL
jgi:hypothetical protein